MGGVGTWACLRIRFHRGDSDGFGQRKKRYRYWELRRQDLAVCDLAVRSEGQVAAEDAHRVTAAATSRPESAADGAPQRGDVCPRRSDERLLQHVGVVERPVARPFGACHRPAGRALDEAGVSVPVPVRGRGTDDVVQPPDGG